jgi:hypothetical protein
MISTAPMLARLNTTQILAGNGDPEEVTIRYLVMDGISARAIEVFGHNLKIDPEVFVMHQQQSLEGCSIEHRQFFEASCNPGRAAC